MTSAKRALQIAVALAGAVPVIAGALGMGPGTFGLSGNASALTHAAYLSGLLLGIGLGYWSLIPTIERRQEAFGLLSAIVVIGGLGRLMTAVRLDIWSPSVTLPLIMELVVTPALWLWQRQVARA
jgi:hypothetical protein